MSVCVLRVFSCPAGTSFDNSGWVAGLDGIVIFFSIISLVQCVRSLINSWHLAIVVRRFFISKFDNFRLKFRQLVPLFNLWHLGVIISNALVIVGSVLKLLISYNVSILSLSLLLLPLYSFYKNIFVHAHTHTHTHSLSLSLLSLTHTHIHTLRLSTTLR